MKSKKLISFLCAAAMTASTFVGMVSTASAAATTLWSDSFDSYKNEITHQTSPEGIGLVLVDGTAAAKSEYAGIEGVKLVTTDRADDSSYFKATDDANGGKAITTTVSRFSNASRGASIDFATEYAPTASNDLVLAFKVKAENDKGTTFDTGFVLNDDNSQNVTIDEDLGITLGEWADVKLVMTPSGTSVYVGDSTTAAKTLTATKLTSINFNGLVAGVSDDSANGAQKSPTHQMGYPLISLDDMVVYNTAAGEGATETTPKAETKGPVEITYEVVPKGEAPEKLGLVAEENFNAVTASGNHLAIQDVEANAAPYDELAVATLAVGNGNSANGDTAWDVVGNGKTDPKLGTDKYIKAKSGKDSSANRGPRFIFKKGEIAERETVVAQFATRLHKSDISPAEVIFSGDLVAGADKGNLSSPLAMITTDAEAKSAVYAVNNPLEQGGANVIEVPDDKWVLVTIEAYRSEGKTASAKISVDVDGTTTYIFGSETEYANLMDNTKSGINILPYVTFRSGNSADYYTTEGGTASGSNTSNDIDNVAVYSSTIDATATPTPKPTATPVKNASIAWDNATKTATVSTTETEAYDAVLMHAAYDSDGALVSLKAYNVEGVVSGTDKAIEFAADDTVYTGDKLMVWNSLQGMLPYAVYTVTDGAAPIVNYDVKVAAAENGTVSVDKTTAPAGEEITITATPAENYEIDTITVKDADNGDVTVTDGKFTMPAKDVTVTVTFKAVAVDPTPTPDVTDPTPTPDVTDPTPTPALTYAVTVATAENGTVTADKATAAEGETVTLTVKPNMGYEGTVTVKDADNGDVTVTDNKFTMPAKAVNVTATFTLDPNKQVIAAAHTAHAQWGSNTAEATMDNDSEYFNMDADSGWTASAFMEFDITNVDISTLDTATVTYTATSGKGYGSTMYYLTGDVDLSALVADATSRFTGAKVSVNAAVPSVQNGVTLTQDITEAVKARLAEGKTSVILQLTGNNGGANLSGKTSDKAPVLLIQKGEAAGKEIAVIVKDNTDAPVEGAVVTAVKKAAPVSLMALNPVYTTSAKTNDQGVATLRLADGDYTITASKDGKTIKSADMTVNAESAAALEIKETTYAVAINGGAETVAIPAGELYTAPAAFTAAVTADTAAVDGAAVAWSVKEADTKTSISEAGVLTVDKAATAGNITLVATYTTPEGNTVTGEKTVALTAPVAATIEVSGDAEAAIPEAAEVAANYSAVAKDVHGNVLADQTFTWSVEGDNVSIADGALTVQPAATAGNVTVKAAVGSVEGTKTVALIAVPTYAITVTTPTEGGTLTASSAKAAADRTVTITAVPATGYKIAENGLTVSKAEGTVATTAGENNTYTFTMPAEAVTVTVQYVKKQYTVTITQPEANATIAVNQTGDGTPAVTSGSKLEHGATFTVTANPSIGYEAAVSVMQGETALEATNGVYTITGDVTITATVTEKVRAQYMALNGETKITAEPFYANQNSYNSSGVWGGKFRKEASEVVLINAKASDLVTSDATSIQSATLTFNAKCTTASKNSTVTIIRLTGDIGTAEFKDITYTTIAEKEGVQVADCGSVNDSGKAVTVDLTNDLRNAGGDAIYAIVTKTGRQQEITNLVLNIATSEQPIAKAVINVQKVYADANGSITIGDGKYTVFGEATPVTGYYAGESFTPVASYKDAIDDTETSRYVYKSGADATTLAAENTIYVVYDKIDYQTTTFTAKIGDTPTAGAVIKITGTPTDTTAEAVDKTITTGDDGTITVKLLPGEYKYALDKTTSYEAVAETSFTLGDNVDVALIANNAKVATVKIATGVEGAKVTLVNSTNAEDTATAFTAADGSVSFADKECEDKTYNYTVDMVGYTQKTGSVTLAASDADTTKTENVTMGAIAGLKYADSFDSATELIGWTVSEATDFVQIKQAYDAADATKGSYMYLGTNNANYAGTRTAGKTGYAMTTEADGFTIEFDARFPTFYANNLLAEISFADSEGNVLIGLASEQLSSKNGSLSAFAGGAVATFGGTAYSTNNTAEKKTKIGENVVYKDNATWLHVKIVANVTDKTAKVTVTNGATALATDVAVTLDAAATKSIDKLYLATGRSMDVKWGNSGICMDNLVITDYTKPVAE